jgi:hypothetical protein
MATIDQPTGHVQYFSDLLTPGVAGDVYIVDQTQEGYEWDDGTQAWKSLGPVPAQAETPPEGEAEPRGGTVGAAVPGTTTLDGLVTLAFSQKSADLAGAISYVWYTPTRVIGTFPAATSPTGKNGACVRIYLEPSVAAPSSLLP